MGLKRRRDLHAMLRLRGQCGVLVTSRKNEDAPDEPLELKRLEEQQAKEVFRRYSGLAINDTRVCKASVRYWTAGRLPCVLPVAIYAAERKTRQITCNGWKRSRSRNWVAVSIRRRMQPCCYVRSVAQISDDCPGSALEWWQKETLILCADSPVNR